MKDMAAYVHDSSFFSRRAIVLMAIIALHVFVIWAVSTGLATRVVQVLAPPIQTDIIEEVQQRDTPPPPPPPEFERPPVEVPPPEVTIELPSEPQSTAITDVTDKPVPKAPPPPPPPRKVVHARIDSKHFPSTEEYYPAASKRLGEEGAITVKVCVGPNGRLAEEPTVVTSSGISRLDEGAVKLAKAGRYVAGSVDGQTTTDCFPFRIKFELKN
jgi:periplasmic protein TonB